MGQEGYVKQLSGLILLKRASGFCTLIPHMGLAFWIKPFGKQGGLGMSATLRHVNLTNYRLN